MTLGERLRKVRKHFDLTQLEFSSRLKMKPNSIAQIEGGRNTSDQTIRMICQEFGINEEWLRTGEGDMFEPKEDDPLDALVKKKRLSGADRILVEKFLALKTDQRKAVMDYILSISDAYRHLGAVPEQKVPTPVSGDGLDGSADSLMGYVGGMNPDQQQSYYNQMHKMIEPQKEASPSAAPASTDNKAPESEPQDWS